MRNEKFVLVDVREPQEYEEWNIDNSINIPLSQISEKISEISQNKKNYHSLYIWK
jgi:Rhodanese-like domain.